MDDIHKNIEEYNPDKKSRTLIVFDDNVADILSNEKLNPIRTDLFVRETTFLVFLSHSLILLCQKILG